MDTKRITVALITDHFGNDGTSGGQLVQDVADAWVVAGFRVHVITEGTPRLAFARVPAHGSGVAMLIDARTGPANRHVGLVRRSAREVGFCIWAAWRVVLGRSRTSVLVVLSSPALLPVFGMLTAHLCRLPYIVVEMDVFPDNAVALGVMRPHSFSLKLLRSLFRAALCGATRVVVLGSCMKTLVRQRYLGEERRDRLITIQNWADGARILPMAKEASALYTRHTEVHSKFIVQFFGNLGKLAEFDTVLTAANLLQNEEVVFVLMGTGIEAFSLETKIAQMGLTNVLMWGAIPEAEQRDALACCDVALVTLRDTTLGVSVPSKLYPTMAMGRPVVAVVPDLCETANTVREGRFGYVVAPGHSQELASALMSLKNDNQLCVAMGRRSREMFEQRFDKPIGTARYVLLVEEAMRG